MWMYEEHQTVYWRSSTVEGGREQEFTAVVSEFLNLNEAAVK